MTYDDSNFRFDLCCLAFADLISSEIEGKNTNQKESLSVQQSGSDKAVRCVCFKNDSYGELVQCCDCYMYLHCDCVLEPPGKHKYRCPICRLQLDGIDPFKDLKNWLIEKNAEIDNINNILNNRSMTPECVSSLIKNIKSLMYN